ncbi:MAG: hypothetical protein H6818_06900 [Phycisphaerales bacterium]|nr:hypothetical protein [Phycisphaerales bacterium]
MMCDFPYRARIGISKTTIGGMCIALGLALAAPVFGQANESKPEEPKPTAVTHPQNPMIWDVDAMMEQAVQQISKRYSLNPTQEQYTRLLLTRRVREFLDEHEGEVRELLQESMDMRMGKAPADKMALQVWAQRALPLYAEASQAILDGNEEWGVILTEDQKKIHDSDMSLMRRSFDGATNTLNQWSEGKGPALPVVQTPNGQNTPTKAPNAKEGEGVTTDPQNVRMQNIEENWKSYVNMFVQAYELDKAAQTSARDKILKEQYEKAQKYRESRADDFERIAKRIEALGNTDHLERQKLKNRQRLLERRIYDLFVEMDERLHKLPTAAQAANVKAEEKVKLEQLYAALAGETGKKKDATADRKTTPRPTKPDATESTSQPDSASDANASAPKTEEKATEKPEPKAEEPVVKPAEKPAETEKPEKKGAPKPDEKVAA